MEESRPHREQSCEHNTDRKLKVQKNDNLVKIFMKPPTLQRIAAVSIARRQWAKPDITKKIIGFGLETDIYKESQKKMFDEELYASLPASLKAEVSFHLSSMFELFKLFRDTLSEHSVTHPEFRIFTSKDYSIYWTMEGTIDMKKSIAEMLKTVYSEIDVCCLYELACFYCLEDDISDFWQKIPNHNKSKFRIAQNSEMGQHIVEYWTSALEDKMDSFLDKVREMDPLYGPNPSVNLCMIYYSVQKCNIVALKYFWKRLEDQEKNAHLENLLLLVSQKIKSIPMVSVTGIWVDILCFLLSNVNFQFQMAEFFQHHSYVLLAMLEAWPYERFFLPTVLEILDTLNEDVYASIMDGVGLQIKERGIGSSIFKELWIASSIRLRNSYLGRRNCRAGMMLVFLKMGRLETARLLLEDVSKEETKQMIINMFEWAEFRSYVYSNDSSYLSTLLSTTALPPECNQYTFERTLKDMLIIKAQYEISCWHICMEWIYDGNFQAVDAFLKWAFQSESEIRDFKREKLHPYSIYCSVITTRNYEHFEHFLNWYFNTEEEIQQFKRDFLLEPNRYYFMTVCRGLFEPEITLAALEEFVKFAFTSSEEIEEFKVLCLEFATCALANNAPQNATNLLTFSLGDIHTVKTYKINYLKSEIRRKNYLINDDLWGALKQIIKWTSPLPLKTLTELKELIFVESPFIQEYSVSSSEVLEFLDSVVEQTVPKNGD